MKYRLIVLLLLFVSATRLNAQEWMQQFAQLAQKKDDAGQQKLLKKWEKVNSQDPELYVAYLNYYYEKSKTEKASIQNYESKGKTELYKDSTKPNVHVYLNTTYDTVLIAKGLSYIDKGIAIAPTRLDLRFGKVYILGEMKKYDEFATEIAKTIQYSIIIKHKWLWSFGEQLKDAEKVIFNTAEKYFKQLSDLEDEKRYDNMLKIVNAQLEMYPNHPTVLTTNSVVNFLKKDYNASLQALFKAEKISPNDITILIGFAKTYTELGDKANAIKYYEKVTQQGSKEATEFANEQIEELKK